MIRTWKRRDFLRHAAMGAFVAPVVSYWRDLPEVRAQPRKTHMVLVFFGNGKSPRNEITLRYGTSWKFAPGFHSTSCSVSTGTRAATRSGIIRAVSRMT